jgi:hypothetical protein
LGVAELQDKYRITGLENFPATALVDCQSVFIRIVTGTGVKDLGEATLEFRPETLRGALREGMIFSSAKIPLGRVLVATDLAVRNLRRAQFSTPP